MPDRPGTPQVQSKSNLDQYASSYATTYVREPYLFWSTYELYTSRRTRTSYVSAKSHEQVTKQEVHTRDLIYLIIISLQVLISNTHHPQEHSPSSHRRAQCTSTSSTDIDPDPNIPNQQRPQPNIFNRSWYRANNPLSPPKVSGPAPQIFSTDVIPNQISATDVGLPCSPSDHEHLLCKTPRLRPGLPQQMPWSHRLSPIAYTTP